MKKYGKPAKWAILSKGDRLREVKSLVAKFNTVSIRENRVLRATTFEDEPRDLYTVTAVYVDKMPRQLRTALIKDGHKIYNAKTVDTVKMSNFM